MYRSKLSLTQREDRRKAWLKQWGAAYYPDYYQRNRERIRLKAQEWRANNRVRKKLTEAQYRLSHKVNIRRYKARWYQANKERVASSHLAYRQAHREHLKEYNCHYRRRQWATNPIYRLRRTIRVRFKAALRTQSAKGSAIQALGCSIPELKEHLTKQFLPGMSWENYGDWEIDHIRHLASFNLMDETQLKQAAHYTNLQPLWALDNRKKWKKETERFQTCLNMGGNG